jgi:FkbM family methyltransferase
VGQHQPAGGYPQNKFSCNEAHTSWPERPNAICLRQSWLRRGKVNRAKSLVVATFDRFGFEISRKPAGATPGMELSGLTFNDFLELYLATRDLSSFVFVQVGAFDGSSNDPVYHFASKWELSGLVVEPQPAVFQTLKSNYQDCHNLVFENVAISTEEGERPLYTIRKDLEFLQYLNQVASFDPELTYRLLKHHLTRQASVATKTAFRRLNLDFKDCIEVQAVKTATLRSLLDKHKILKYDFLQIDTEGFDYEVLKLAHIEANLPGLINYEHKHLKPGDRQAAWKYLRDLGYRIFTHEGDTSAFLPVRSQRPRIQQH